MGSPAKNTRLVGPGDRLAGKYELIRQLAVGGMAELYLARTLGIEGFEKLSVIKRILPQFMDDAHFVSMFLNEARLAAALHHPNIAQVFDIGVEQGDYFFSMEYVHGENLGQLAATAIDSGVPVSLDAALTLIVGLCAGLHYAHEKLGTDGKPLRVVHRDVSPSNVLVTYDGAVKLVDFGIARAASAPQTLASGLKGKVAYMSPEQCRGLPLDRRSDLFSVGTILYELTTGQQPFADHSRFGTLEKIVKTDPAPPSSLVPSYPEALERIVLGALARDPDRRYTTALELQGHLEDFAHETRLRVSPLVVARLMSTLFPARLEEWERARAQGAFFVEQAVVRTWIEKTGEGDPSELSAADDGQGAAQQVGVGDTTTRLPTPLPFATAQRVATPPVGSAVVRASSATPAPIRASSAVASASSMSFAPAAAGTFGLPSRVDDDDDLRSREPRRPSSAHFEETKLVRINTRRMPLIVGVFGLTTIAGIVAAILVSRGGAVSPAKSHGTTTIPTATSATTPPLTTPPPVPAVTAPPPTPAPAEPASSPREAATSPSTSTPLAPSTAPATAPPVETTTGPGTTAPPAPAIPPVAPPRQVQPTPAPRPNSHAVKPHPSQPVKPVAKPDTKDPKEPKWDPDAVFLPDRSGN